MVVAVGLLSIVGSLLAYGGYTYINSDSGDSSRPLNTTQVNMVNSDNSSYVVNNLSLPLDTVKNSVVNSEFIEANNLNTNENRGNPKFRPVSISSNTLNKTQGNMINSDNSSYVVNNISLPLDKGNNSVDNLEFIESKNHNTNENRGNPKFRPLSIIQKLHVRDKIKIIENKDDSNELPHTKKVHQNISHEGLELNESELLNKSNSNQEVNLTDIPMEQGNKTSGISQDSGLKFNGLQEQNLDPTVLFDTQESDANDNLYQGRELVYINLPDRLNPKLTLLANSNKNNLEKNSEKQNLHLKKNLDFEPFPSSETVLNNKQNMDNIPENSLYGIKYHKTQDENIKNPVKHPLYPTHDEHEDHLQDNEFHINENDYQFNEEKVDQKLSLKFNKKHNPNFETNNFKEVEAIIKNDINLVVNEHLEKEGKLMEPIKIENEDSNTIKVKESAVLNPALESLFQSLVSSKDESINMEDGTITNEVQKTLLVNTENKDENIKTLFVAYAEIAGLVIAAVLIVTVLIFLSVRQALKYRRHNKIKRRYLEKDIGKVSTLTYAYSNNVE